VVGNGTDRSRHQAGPSQQPHRTAILQQQITQKACGHVMHLWFIRQDCHSSTCSCVEKEKKSFGHVSRAKGQRTVGDHLSVDSTNSANWQPALPNTPVAYNHPKKRAPDTPSQTRSAHSPPPLIPKNADDACHSEGCHPSQAPSQHRPSTTSLIMQASSKTAAHASSTCTCSRTLPHGPIYQSTLSAMPQSFSSAAQAHQPSGNSPTPCTP